MEPRIRAIWDFSSPTGPPRTIRDRSLTVPAHPTPNTFASACLGACLTDLDQNGVTNGPDLGLLFVAWGSCPDCQPDLNGDGVVDGQDLGILFLGWGPCD